MACWQQRDQEGAHARCESIRRGTIPPPCYVVRAEMPGVRKEDLEITIAGDRLTFEAKRDFEEKEEKEDFFRSEMAYGRLFRVVPLPVEVMGDKAKAELKDGVAEVYLPKLEAVTPHTVKVA